MPCYKAADLPGPARQTMYNSSLEPEEYYEIWVVPQSQGYEDVVVCLCDDGITVICQRGSENLVIWRQEGQLLGTLMQQLGRTPDRRYLTRDLESAGRVGLLWGGTRDGNPGDWSIGRDRHDHEQRIRG